MMRKVLLPLRFICKNCSVCCSPPLWRIFGVEQLEAPLGPNHFCLLLNAFVMTALGDLFPCWPTGKEQALQHSTTFWKPWSCRRTQKCLPGFPKPGGNGEVDAQVVLNSFCMLVGFQSPPKWKSHFKQMFVFNNPLWSATERNLESTSGGFDRFCILLREGSLGFALTASHNEALAPD